MNVLIGLVERLDKLQVNIAIFWRILYVLLSALTVKILKIVLQNLSSRICTLINFTQSPITIAFVVKIPHIKQSR
ncbi:hypothetical protein NIES4071_68960 [Calothrix sp. NIES-4071]|nr:hypothetical protein NIES4071_68960 [Calothrix sp. NIES-4071]BAZ61174.1 hypothetical protein NIES4105_68920 [Calothrix sp. NIES-4105]